MRTKGSYDEALRTVEEYFTVPGVVALGEVGLEVESDADMLRDQLKIAKNLDKPAIVHTPKRNKVEQHD